MILILTKNSDITSDKVCVWLNYFKVPFLRINENINAFEEIKISNMKTEIRFKYKEKIYNLLDFKIIWNRRGFFTTLMPDFNLLNLRKEKVYQVINSHLYEERKTLHNFIFESLSKQFHINDPRQYNANKLISLQTVVECGLNIPETSIVQDISKLNKSPENLITKNIQDVLSYFDGKISFGHSTKEVTELDLSVNNCFYSLFQEKIEKKYEIRSFVFFDKVFSMAIFSQNNSKTSTDFRNYDRENPNRMIPFKLPETVEKKLLNFMQKMNLESGSVDFIYNGKDFVFLEVNPVGQFDFVSVLCNYKIEKVIAQKLSEKYNELYLN